MQHDPWQRVVTIGSLVSVIFVGIGLYITNEANREQQRLAEQGQITERFTTAVEQLGQPGPEKIDVRLGGLDALERIMRDSARPVAGLSCHGTCLTLASHQMLDKINIRAD